MALRLDPSDQQHIQQFLQRQEADDKYSASDASLPAKILTKSESSSSLDNHKVAKPDALTSILEHPVTKFVGGVAAALFASWLGGKVCNSPEAFLDNVECRIHRDKPSPYDGKPADGTGGNPRRDNPPPSDGTGGNPRPNRDR